MAWLLVIGFLIAAATPVQAGPNHQLPDGYRQTVLGDQFVHRFFDVDLTFQDWEAEFPEWVTVTTIGESTLGLPLLNIEVRNPDLVDHENLQRPAVIYLDGGHHGNEYLGVELVMYELHRIMDGIRSGDEGVLDLLSDTVLYATPMLNPEGNLLDTRKTGNQVDINRNYGFGWGGPGSSDLILDFTYRGSEPMSEPEVQANAAFAANIVPDLWITMHTGIAEFYWPWGFTFDLPPDNEMFIGLEAPFEAATNGRVDAMQAAALYLAAGATDDYGYGALGVPTFTFEVHEDQFIPVYGEPIPAIISDQLQGLRFMMEETPFLGALLNPHEMDGGFHIWNGGRGAAVNVTILVDGAVVETIDRIEPQTMVVYDAPFAETFEIEYQRLLIDSSRREVLTYEAESFRGEAPDVEAPVLGPLALVALLAIALVRRQRD